jgi:CheY-like chemotaxis protein
MTVADCALQTGPSTSPSIVSRRILLVEDNPDGRATMQMLLELWGHRVKAAGNGVEGVQLALTWQPDVAVLDIGLPLLDGYQVAQRLRAVFRDHILLIALTGYGQPQDRQRAFDAGFDVHMTKPANLDQLFHLLAG